MAVGARSLVIVCASGNFILGLVGISLIVSTYASYRAKDFTRVTSHANLADLGSCVESAHADVLKDVGIGDPTWGCDTDSKSALGRLLATQTHSIYYLNKLPAKQTVETEAVASSLMTAMLGFTPQTVNRSMAFAVLSMLDDADVTIPSKCSDIYTSAYSASWYDTSTALHPAVSCDGDALTGTNKASFDATDLKRLAYACDVQFMFGRSGPHADTYGIPLLNEVPGPMWYPWPNTSYFNETSHWNTKSRMYMGFRFGWSLWAYVPAILALGYLTMDAAVVLLAETTIEARSEGVIETEEKSADAARFKLLHNAATYIKQRARRFIIASLLVINSLIWLSVACWSVWGLWMPRLGRPVCGDDDTEWFVYWRFYPKTIGGWKQDWDAQYSESLAAILQIFILISLPAARQYAQSTRASGGSVTTPAAAQPKGYVAVLERSLRTPRFTILIIIGIVVIIVGNAFVGSAFGNAWARAIAGEPDLNWNEVTIAEYIYEINLGTLLTILAGGLTLAAVVGRWMIDTLSCQAVNTFLVWIVFAFASFAPIFFLYQFNYFFDTDLRLADCKVFDTQDGRFDVEYEGCNVRNWTYAIGTFILIGTVILVTVAGLSESLPALQKAIYRKKNDANEQVPVPGSVPTKRIGGLSSQQASARGSHYTSDETFFNFKSGLEAANEENSTRALLAPSPPPPANTLGRAAGSKMLFSLDPNKIAPKV